MQYNVIYLQHIIPRIFFRQSAVLFLQFFITKLHYMTFKICDLIEE